MPACPVGYDLEMLGGQPAGRSTVEASALLAAWSGGTPVAVTIGERRTPTMTTTPETVTVYTTPT